MKLKVGELKDILKGVKDNKKINVSFDFHRNGKRPSINFINNNGKINLRISGSFSELLNKSEEILDNKIIQSYLPF